MRATTMLLLAGFAAPGLAWAADCSSVNQPQPLQPTVVAPIATELAAGAGQLGAPEGVLARAYDESESVDQVLLRIRIETCRSMAMATPAPGVVSPDNPAAYKPRTQYDNTPWRFNMSQNGKNMTADEFSAWMKARGVRVAKGNGAAAAPAASSAVPTAAPSAVPGLAPAAATPPTASGLAPVTTGVAAPADAWSTPAAGSTPATATAVPALPPIAPETPDDTPAKPR